MSQLDLFDNQPDNDHWLEPRSSVVPASRPRKRRIWKLLFAMLIVGGIAYLVLSKEWAESFPALEPGAWAGMMLEGDRHVPVYLEQRAGGGLLFWQMKDGADPLLIAQNAKSGALRFRTAGGDEVVVSGTLDKDGRLAAKIRNGDDVKMCSLARVPESSVAADEALRLWLLMNADLRSVERTLEESEQKIPEQKKDIARLMNFIEAREGLRASADRKFDQEKEKAEKAKASLSERQEKVEKLQKKVELAYHVTDMGRLVARARESLDQERVWAQAALGGGVVPEETPELREAYEKAKRISVIRRQIEEENARIQAMLHRGEDNNAVR